MRRAGVRQHEVAAEPDPRLVQRSQGVQGEHLARVECDCQRAAHPAERRLQLASASLAADDAVLLLQAPLAATTTNGLPSITATFTDITTALAANAPKDGHPEMGNYVQHRTAGPASLQIAFIPNAQGDGEHASDFVISSGVKRLSCAALPDGGRCTMAVCNASCKPQPAVWWLGVHAHRLTPYQISSMRPTML